MRKKITPPGRLGWALLLALGLGAAIALWTSGGGRRLEGQSPLRLDRTGSSGVFTPAHESLGEAVRHFLGLRDEPSQPIAFSHQLHVGEVALRCDFCHDAVSIGPVAGIPSVATCMLCHSEVAADRPDVQLLMEYYDDGTEPPWERVYGWPEEAHVRFNHRPHYNAGVGCEVCHGDVSTMGVARRAVEHTMAFCVDCHQQEQASNECLACHY